MDLDTNVIKNLINSELEKINFLLDLINSNKTLSLSLINTFISSFEFKSSEKDMEEFNKMILELQLILNDNNKAQENLIEQKNKFIILKEHATKKKLVSALEEIHTLQSKIFEIELKLYSYTPKLLNKVNKNILTITFNYSTSEKNYNKNHTNKSFALYENVLKSNTTPNLEKIDNSASVAKYIPFENTNSSSTCITEEKINNNLNVISTINNSDSNNINSNTLENVNTQLPKNIDKINNNDQTLDEFIDEALSSLNNITSHEIINTTSNLEKNNNTDNSSTSEINTKVVNITEKTQNNNNFIDINENNFHKETLLISEITGTVIFPYTNEEVGIHYFRNSSISRFREAFYLSRRKNHSSIVESINLGFELMFKSDLHPAIIAACQNLDELESYITFLDAHNTKDFPYFNIIYESLPAKVK